MPILGENRPRKKGLHVAIGIPTAGQWEANFGVSLSAMLLKYTQYPIAGVSSIKVTTNSVSSSMLAHNRDVIVKNAIKAEADYLLFLDDDMTFPPDTMSRLVAWNVPFVAAQGVTKQRPADPVAIGMDGKRVLHNRETGLVEVEHVGMAVALVKVSWLKKMSMPRFEMPYEPSVGAPMGEDVYFCRKWKKEVKQKIFIDKKLSWEIGHLGTYEFGLEDVPEVQRPKVVRPTGARGFAKMMGR